MNNCRKTCNMCARFLPEGRPAFWGDRKNLCQIWNFDDPEGCRQIQDPETHSCASWQSQEDAANQRQQEQEQEERFRQYHIKNSCMVGNVYHTNGLNYLPKDYTGTVCCDNLFFEAIDGNVSREEIWKQYSSKEKH